MCQIVEVLIKYLETFVEKIILIGIQPKNLSGKITLIIKKSGLKDRKYNYYKKQ